MRLRQQEAMDRAIPALEEIEADWGRRFGRRYGAIESYRTEGADTVLVTSGTVTSTARYVVDERRARGENVGLVKVKMFRPFPTGLMREALAGKARVAVLDRNISPGHGGIFAEELRSALYDLEPARRPHVDGFIIGLGGRDVTPEVIGECIDRVPAELDGAGAREDVWVGVQP